MYRPMSVFVYVQRIQHISFTLSNLFEIYLHILKNRVVDLVFSHF